MALCVCVCVCVRVQQTGTNKLNTMSNRRNFAVPFPAKPGCSCLGYSQCHDVSLFGLAEEKTELLQLTPLLSNFPFESYSPPPPPFENPFRLDFEKLISEESSKDRRTSKWIIGNRQFSTEGKGRKMLAMFYYT